MTYSFRKLAIAVAALAALSLGGASTAHAGILLILTDGNNHEVLRLFNGGNALAYTATDPTGGYQAISGLITTDYPGTPGVGPGMAGTGTVTNNLNVTTNATGPVTSLTATAFITNSNNPNDLLTFTTPKGNVVLNNDLTAAGGPTVTSGTAFLQGIALGVGYGATTANLVISAPIPGAAVGNQSFNAPLGYNLINATGVSGLNNGAVLASVTGKTTVAGGVLVPEPGTMAAALTGLVFVGGGLLRRRKK